jgi:hypothetical protein
MLASPRAVLPLQAGQTSLHFVVEGGVVVVPTLLDGAVAKGGATLVWPTPDPGWLVGRSVPEALGRLFVVVAVDSLDPPAGGLCVVVSGFCASAGAALKMAHATISILITGVLSVFVDVKACRTGQVSPVSRRCHTY